ncbi:hypothetical protein [Paenibacillus jiagnxiensis]|uniref:hypothetical protein n=1 Tax=Paenibacillus jiagnxiensis TaxID=3228926 RepID=UPI0033B98791
MKFFNKIKRHIVIILSFALIFTIVSPNLLYATPSVTSDVYDNLSVTDKIDDNIEILENNDSFVTVTGEEDGVRITATYNKTTHEITMTSVEEQSNIMGFSLTPPEEKTYTVEVETAIGGEIEAIATDNETKREYKIESPGIKEEKVQAQAAIPVAQWLGQAILNALLLLSAVLIIDGIHYVDLERSETQTRVKKEKNVYYYAVVDYDTNHVFIGNQVNYSGARAWLAKSHDNNIFTRDRINAYTLARNYTNKEPIEHTNEWATKGEGYYRHFHPGSVIGGKLNNHIWYINYTSL